MDDFDPTTEKNIENLLQAACKQLPQPDQDSEKILFARLAAELPKKQADFPLPVLGSLVVILLATILWLLGKNMGTQHWVLLTSANIISLSIIIVNGMGILLAIIILLIQRKSKHAEN